ncbi:hypothetical protein IE81DRAFT_325478 [Ceraceosorus guamensis]|uniref:Ion transport domain-containing protein n=1 Tax=Ceraceosorus guamensis TaxID=1522189 RepID=A0A316VST0_9BASI|nr:hypothetical protein IE81DRAFT_325478 [Ceraceosorus guamensis]PWN40542.1 hypothetical protein IE81DRAFT_325478 [Ceraceosorus guamensis]
MLRAGGAAKAATATAAAITSSRRASRTSGGETSTGDHNGQEVDMAASTELPRGDGGETDPLLEAATNSKSTGALLLEECATQSVYPLVHTIRSDVRATIDSHLSWEELTGVDLNFTIVRPLALKYSRYKSLCILFVLLLNRIEFLREADRDLAFQSVNLTRASLCELLAIKLLRTFSHDGLQLVTALTAPFSPFAGAPFEPTPSTSTSPSTSGSSSPSQQAASAAPSPHTTQTSSAMELAIYSGAKRFIKSPLCQRCIDGIWTGRVVLSAPASHAIVDDSYKKRPLSIYDPAKAPLLDHYRLRVPLIRSRIEFCNFVLLLCFFVLALQQKGSQTWTGWETVFTIWVFGFALDEAAQLQEHGVEVYASSLYNLLDASFCIVAFSWLGLRISGLVHSDALRCDLSFDCLAVGAILLCPRVASSLVQDNVILLALKAMFADFAFFMLLASICFSGFLYAFWSLSDKSEWTVGSIMWLMLKIWFGSSYIGFDTATDFSPIFGPPLMVFFAIMANTLLLTVLISLLSNTFTVVATNAAEEAMFQHACKTMLGVTTDALFSYIPPLNLIGVLVVLPASYVLTPRWLHKLNVALIRATHWPMLLLIRATQKRGLREGVELTASRASRAFSWMPLPRSGKSDMDIVDAVFSRSPPEDQGRTLDSLATRHRNADLSFREYAKSGGGPSSASLPRDPEGCSHGAEGQAGYGAVETSGKQTANVVPSHVDKASGTTRPSSREQETQTKDGKRSSSPSAASRALEDAQGGTFASASSRPDHSNPSQAFSLSSPLARIFSGGGGGGGGRRRGRNAAVSPLRQARPDKDAAAAADAHHFTDEDGDGGGASTRDLFLALSERLDQQEKRSRRIEELLVSLVERQASPDDGDIDLAPDASGQPKADKAEDEAQQASSSG